MMYVYNLHREGKKWTQPQGEYCVTGVPEEKEKKCLSEKKSKKKKKESEETMAELPKLN